MANEIKPAWNEFAGRSGSFSDEYTVAALIGLTALGITCWYFRKRKLNDKFDNLDSAQQEFKEDHDLTKQRIVILEKKVMIADLRADALKRVVDNHRQDFLIWHPTF